MAMSCLKRLRKIYRTGVVVLHASCIRPFLEYCAVPRLSPSQRFIKLTPQHLRRRNTQECITSFDFVFGGNSVDLPCLKMGERGAQYTMEKESISKGTRCTEDFFLAFLGICVTGIWRGHLVNVFRSFFFSPPASYFSFLSHHFERHKKNHWKMAKGNILSSFDGWQEGCQQQLLYWILT